MLTDIKVKSTKPKEKAFKLSDSGGLYLHVKPNGGKYWRLKYRFAGKEKKLTVGMYGRNFSIPRKEKTGKRSCRRRYSLVN